MKTYKIPVEWTVCDYVYTEANSLEEAIKNIQDEINEIPLGCDPEYVDGSYKISGVDETSGEIDIEYIKFFQD